MPEVVTDLIVSPVTIYYAPVGTTLPADTLAVAGAWPAGWVKVGFTKEPLQANFEFDVLDKKIEQALAPVGRRRTSEDLTLSTVLAELTGDVLEKAFGMALSATGTVETINFGGNPVLTERMWGFEGSYYDEDAALFPVRMFLWKGTPKEGGELEFSKGDYVGIPLQIGALEDMTKAVGQRLGRFVKVIE